MGRSSVLFENWEKSVRASEIVITFKDRLHDIFSKDRKNVDGRHPNRLIIRVQPDEGLRLQLRSKNQVRGYEAISFRVKLVFGETFQSRLRMHMNAF